MSPNKVLWIYIILLVIGGLIGFLKGKSQVSLIMSVSCAAALSLCAANIIFQPYVADILLAALLVVFRHRLGRIDFRETASSFLRVTVASLALAAIAYPVWYGLDQALGRSVPAQVVSLGSAFVAGFGVYLISCRLLGVRELEPLLSLTSRLRRG